MTGAGDWTIPDLVDYLVSVELETTEVEQLQDNPAFPDEATTEQNKNEGGTPKEIPKHRASELYEPLDVFRKLGLPILDWQGKGGVAKWEPSSKQGTPYTLK